MQIIAQGRTLTCRPPQLFANHARPQGHPAGNSGPATQRWQLPHAPLAAPQAAPPPPRAAPPPLSVPLVRTPPPPLPPAAVPFRAGSLPTSSPAQSPKAAGHVPETGAWGAPHYASRAAGVPDGALGWATPPYGWELPPYAVHPGMYAAYPPLPEVEGSNASWYLGAASGGTLGAHPAEAGRPGAQGAPGPEAPHHGSHMAVWPQGVLPWVAPRAPPGYVAAYPLPYGGYHIPGLPPNWTGLQPTPPQSPPYRT